MSHDRAASLSRVRARSTARARRRVRAVAAVLSAVLAGSAGGASAAFTATTSTAENSITTGADTTGPAVERATVAKSTVVTAAGRIQSGTGYYIYAQVTDAVSAMNTVTADRPTPTGQVTLTTTGGPWTVAGVSYNYRSPLATAAASLTTGTTLPYQVRATDSLNNATTTNWSATVETYAQAVAGTPGVLAHWRLESGAVGTDEFSLDAATLRATGYLTTGDHTWVKRSAATTPDMQLVTHTPNPATGPDRFGNFMTRRSAAGTATFEYAIDPGTNDYAVEADLVVRSLDNGELARVRARTANLANDLSGYEAGYQYGATAATREWYIVRRNAAGTDTILAEQNFIVADETTYRMRLEVQGTAIRLLVNGTQVLATTDNTYTRQGRSGITHGGTVAPGANVAFALDNFAVHSRETITSADLISARPVTLGGMPAPSPGALIGDTNGSLRFDGSDDLGDVTRVVQDDFSLEVWFNATQGIGAAGGQWWTTASLMDADVAAATNDFGMGLDSTGRVVAGVGPNDTSIRSGPDLHNGQWHHVVFTRTRANGAMVLYVDGAQVTTGTGSTASLNTPTTIALAHSAAQAARSTAGFYFRGDLDEAALYNSALSLAQVQDHWRAGHGGTRPNP